MGKARCDEQRIGKTVAHWKISWRKLVAPPTAVCTLPSRRIRRRQIGLGEVRDENKILVTRAWRYLCGTVSDRTVQTILLTKIALVFARAARGCAVRNWLLEFGISCSRLRFCPPVYVSFSRNIRSWGQCIVLLGQGLPLSFAGICALSYLYDCPFFAHHSSICLYLFYAEFAFPMDMISQLSYWEDTAHSHFDMIILTDFYLIFNWIFADVLLLIWPPTTLGLIWWS